MQRTVHRLQLRIPRAELALRCRQRLEDALRTASLQDEDRHWVVRRLDLGPLDEDASASSWALRLEQRLAAVIREAVRHDSPGAASAPLVWFSGRHGAALAYLQLRASGLVPSEWFWTAALPELRETQDPAQAERRLLSRLVREEPRVLLALLRRLTELPQFSRLLRGLSAPEANLLCHVFMETEAFFGRAPSYPHGPASTGPSGRMDRDNAGHMSRDDDNQPLLRLLHLLNPAERHASTSSPPSHRQESHGQPESLRPVPPSPELREETLPSPATPLETRRVPTSLGGLFFLIRLFEKDPDTAALLFLREHRWNGLGWALLQDAASLADRKCRDALFEHLPLPSPSLAPGLRWRCLLRADRLCLQKTGFRLQELVSRRAEVSFDEQHLDVFLAPSEARVPVRKAGLDFDPGWVPWLGLTVRFHYTQDS